MPNEAWLIFPCAGVVGYLLGSIPFGLVITKLAGLGDIRDIGSGNIGATNVLRTGRKDLALATFLLDSGKAGLAALLFWFLTPAFNPPIALFAGACAFIGHCYPVWLKFKGGKGVATFFGLLFAAVWKIGLIAAASWLLIAYIFRRSSLAGIGTAVLMPIFAWAMNYTVKEVIILVLLALLVLWRHRANIERLLDGTEPNIGQKSDTSSS